MIIELAGVLVIYTYDHRASWSIGCMIIELAGVCVI